MKKTSQHRFVAVMLTISFILSLVGCASNKIDISVSENLTDTESVSSGQTVPPPETPVPSPIPTPSPSAAPTAIPSAEPISHESTDEYGLTKQQRNSFSMLYYLAITAENIRISNHNKLILDDIYTSLLNDINPGAIDETTQDHLQSLCNVIKDYIDISTKRSRLQYRYNQDKASAMRQAVPDPLAVLSMTHAYSWKSLAANAVFTIVDSYNNYKSAEETADQAFLMRGWELDDASTNAIRKNREFAFNYMVDMVQEYDLDGSLTLNEKAIESFAKICSIESVHQKQQRLEAEYGTYKLLGMYWLELAECYYETSQYEKCLSCIEQYNKLSTGIFRKDHDYVHILPKVIVAAQMVYTGDNYLSHLEEFADAIIRNTETEEWSVRYFAAEVYLDLYARTNNRKFLEAAYNIACDNVTILIDEQKAINNTYLEDVKELEAIEPDYSFMTDDQKAAAKEEYKEEKQRLNDYNKWLKSKRKTELPTLYEPLTLNCDLLFALADKMQIDKTEKRQIEAILQTESNGIFLSEPINSYYSFTHPAVRTSVSFQKDKLQIPVSLLTSESKITITVSDNGKKTIFEDCTINAVNRESSDLKSFYASITSKKLKDYAWTANSTVNVSIIHRTGKLSFPFKVAIYEERWPLSDKVVFEAV